MTKVFTKEQIKEIREIYLRLKSVHKVSKKLHISISTAYKYAGDLAPHQNIITSLKTKNERLIGIYVGLWMGDGTQFYNGRFNIKICSNKKDILLNSFIQDVIFRLFGKTTTLVMEDKTNRAVIRLWSRFIYNFIYTYVKHERNKTHTVRLRKNINKYSKAFLEGCLLGLILSDGYLKERLTFNVTSVKLAKNMIDILRKFRCNPHKYVCEREKFGYKDLQSISLVRSESKMIENLFNSILLKLGHLNSFNDLKYSREKMAAQVSSQ